MHNTQILWKCSSRRYRIISYCTAAMLLLSSVQDRQAEGEKSDESCALKGQHMIAQGIALGGESRPNRISPEGER